MGVIDDGNDVFAFAVESTCFVDEAFFASVVIAIAFEAEGLAEESEHVVPGVKGAVDDGGNPLFLVVVDEGVLEDGLPGAGFAEDEAEANTSSPSSTSPTSSPSKPSVNCVFC